MRWLFCAHKPENDLLFGYHVGDDVRREFLIPLWNVYSFFANYARLDGWTPGGANFDPDYPEGETPKSDNLLDRWILARLNKVVQTVGEALDNSDSGCHHRGGCAAGRPDQLVRAPLAPPFLEV
jgi:isoleucyl-tRNA synthetase